MDRSDHQRCNDSDGGPSTILMWELLASPDVALITTGTHHERQCNGKDAGYSVLHELGGAHCARIVAKARSWYHTKMAFVKVVHTGMHLHVCLLKQGL